MDKDFIIPEWPAPKNVKAYTTLKKEGFSLLPKRDSMEKITENRLLLKKMLRLPNDPIWIKQIHSNIVCEATLENMNVEADASFTKQPNQVCIVLTADCLPILICDRKGTQVAAIHGGWRGLALGVIQETVKALNTDTKNLLAWIGPCISAQHYEVDNEVRDAFIKDSLASEEGFTTSNNNPKKWLADLIFLATLRLQAAGIENIFGGEYCTFSSPELFYSYRRDKVLQGHLATLIWFEKQC